MDFKSFDYRSLKKYLGPQAGTDLNAFLEKLPQNAGKQILYAALIAWGAAGAVGLYATVQAKSLTEMRAKLAETSALKPSVPQIKDKPVSQDEIKGFIEGMARTYPNLGIRQRGANVEISAPTTAGFGQFREAVGHVQNGGDNWRITTDTLCVGRECKGDQLKIILKVNKVSVE